MPKERRKKVAVSDILIEKRALIGNILASLAVLFLAWISVNVTELTVSSKVQERELVSMNKYFTTVLETIQKQLDSHVSNDKIHFYNTKLQAKGDHDGD